MRTNNKILDDLTRIAASTFGTFQGVRDEVEVKLRDQLERVLSSLDLVTREEFDAVKAMVGKARDDNEELKKRLDKLEVSPKTMRSRTDGKLGAKRKTVSKPPRT